ncbi:hypothetical protein K0038_00984 [Pseudomonas syringae]|uniref:hypothetical protein n=1 Tax=Pseudomonas syringae TaxID=317 RepID=UPI001CA940F6|nr:hypothetical protein [Pseudomonas syringae]MCI3943979.1 hypothetical protein [Pseudomonas syringae]
MAYLFLSDFIVEVGYGVGEFSSEHEKLDFIPLTLAEIVKGYVDKRHLLNVFLLRRQIKIYIRKHMTADGLSYVDPPFGQETSFPEDYFEGDLYVFLTNVLTLLDLETKRRVREFFRLNRTV